jgi:hypothetical protein
LEDGRWRFGRCSCAYRWSDGDNCSVVVLAFVGLISDGRSNAEWMTI